MTNVGEAYVEVRADTSRVATDIEKGVTSSIKQAETAARKFGDGAQSGFGRAARSVEGFTKRAALPASIALAGVTTMMLGSARAAEEVEVANKRLSQILASMGYPEATARVSGYADSLERQVAVDAEVVKATQAKLATFANLTATINEQGGAFDRATLAALDLAAAGFGSAESNAVQLGKALQDPVKGVGALARAGVTFTAQEKAKIKTLVESNRMLDAQNLVLAAIEKQVGGTAAATATDSARMQIAFDNIRESIGQALLPMLQQLTNVLQTVGGWISQNKGLFLALVAAITVVSGAIIATNMAFKAYNAMTVLTTGLNKALGTSFTTLQTSLGVVGLALGAAATIYAIVGGKKKDYVETTQSLVDALRLEGEAQDDAVANLIATDDGIRILAESAKELGFSFGQVREAILKGGPAYDRIARAIINTADKQGLVNSKFTEAFAVLKGARENVLRLGDAYDLLGTKAALGSGLASAANAVAAGLNTAVVSTTGLGGAVSKAKQKIDEFRDSLKSVQESAKSNLARAKEEFASFARSVASSISNGLSLTQAYADKGTGTFLEALTKQANDVKEFGSLINRLIAGGASEAVIQQVLGAGTEAGTAIANELLSTTGGIETANKLATEVASIADTVGANAAGSFRQAGVDTATALIAGIESVVKTYRLRLKTKGLTEAQITKLRRNFEADISFNFVSAGADVPQLADGALVRSPQLAMIGEAGPEAVVPISRPARALDLLERSGLATLVRQNSQAAPAVQIGSATFVSPIDADLLASKIVVAERLRGWSS